ncbi:hypothetical protein [Oceaniglobus trochenteri]|uniref:hypothetical protein n=1 Tax=Oceaniglobus trochenteri TaxID=2763260 RepID=UPI001CFFCEFA|nr:hypothetical protein [Oceaniglobus trochenteri]
MRKALFLAFVLLLPGGIAWGGAWPREKGGVFLSLSQNVSHEGNGRPDGYRAIYLEYGVTPRLTFGAKLWQRADRAFGDALVFARYPVGDPDGAHRFALGLALGVRHYDGGETRPAVQSEASWGKGFQSRFGDGWMALDGAFGQTIGGGDRWLKLDFTLGLKPDEKTHLILQLRGHDETRSGRVAVLAPSYVRAISERLKVEVGMTYRLRGANRVGATLGTWIEF